MIFVKEVKKNYVCTTITSRMVSHTAEQFCGKSKKLYIINII